MRQLPTISIHSGFGAGELQDLHPGPYRCYTTSSFYLPDKWRTRKLEIHVDVYVLTKRLP